MNLSEDNIDSSTHSLRINDSQNAFERIYRKHAAELFRYARKNIPIKEDCEEIIQEVFISLWERHQELHIASLRHYLFSAVRYKMIRYFQHKRVVKKYEAHYLKFEAGQPEPMPAKVLREEKLLESLAELPERCQEAFSLRLKEHLSNKEIAARMNISVKTVEAHLAKAMRHLRQAQSQILEILPTLLVLILW